MEKQSKGTKAGILIHEKESKLITPDGKEIKATLRIRLNDPSKGK